MMSNTIPENESSIYDTEYQINLKSLLLFEMRSLYGRLFLSTCPKLNQNNQNYLHLGCGMNKFEGWINADFFAGLKPWKKYTNGPDWTLDLRYSLKCKDNSWDGVFTEHTLEHLYPVHALNLIKELYRTMKPKAWIRVTVPDLKKYVNYYCGEKVDDNFLQWSTGCEAIHSLTQNYIHLSVWDSKLLGRLLQEVGFINIKEVSFMEGLDPMLLKDRKDRQWETLYMEAQKPGDIK